MSFKLADNLTVYSVGEGDAAYVNVVGDTMTGALIIASTGAQPDLKVVRSAGLTPPEVRLVNTSSTASYYSMYEVEGSDGAYFGYEVGAYGQGLHFYIVDGGGVSHVLGFIKSNRATMLGSGAYATATNATAVGKEAAAHGGASVSVGAESYTSDTLAVAVGPFAWATAAGSVSIGKGRGSGSGQPLENATANSVLLGVSDSSVTIRSVYLYVTETVFNEDGENLDLRIEGDTDANLFFVGASTDRVGVGTNSPSVKFEVVGQVTISSPTQSGSVHPLIVEYTGASGASNGSEILLSTNDGSAMASGERLGLIAFNGFGSAARQYGAFMIGRTTETWSGSARGTKLEIYVTPNTTTTNTLAVTINQDLEVDFAGNVDVGSGKVFKVNATQVVSARDTGWTAMTGSSNKATSYDTATVTLAQLAGRVMALQAALTTHGLIGA